MNKIGITKTASLSFPLNINRKIKLVINSLKDSRKWYRLTSRLTALNDGLKL